MVKAGIEQRLAKAIIIRDCGFCPKEGEGQACIVSLRESYLQPALFS